MSDTMPFPLADHIRVSRDGRVESCLNVGCRGGLGSTWRPLAINMEAPGGYPTVHIKMRGKHRSVGVHIVVAKSWLGLPGPGLMCRHLDDNKMNFNLSNLAWGTNLENAADAIANGKTRRGERSGMAKLTDFERGYMRYASVLGFSQAELAREHGVTSATVSYVVRGRPARRN